MCGIAGFSLSGPPPEDLLRSMTETLSHRGPDGSGLFREEGVGLGHRRLAVLDVEGGAQPLFNESRSVVVVYNGEIYNYRSLRKELAEKGHRFATNTDTEVLVHLYEEEGEAFLSRLDGIFAFALYDRERKRLLLARDPVGVKPLYYARTEEGLLFGSELKAVARCPWFRRKVDRESLRSYLTCEYLPGSRTIYEGAYKLLPGHLLASGGAGEFRCRPYWDWGIPAEAGGGREECRSLLRETILRNVRSQLVSDVPLGVFLSGGVDSSIVAASMREAGARVESFSIGFEDPSFDESGHARRVAAHLGTSHHEKRFDEAAVLKELPSVLAHMDEPLADPSLLPTALLSRFARERITVALGGDGGDELFAGYPTYWVHRGYPLYRALPGPLRRTLLAAADRLLPVSHENLTFPYKLRKFRDGAEADLPDRHFYWMGAFHPGTLPPVLAPGAGLPETLPDPAPKAEKAWPGDPPFGDPVTRAQWLDFHTYLVEGVLAKVDRASMMASLEVRVPLLAPEVVRLAFSMPAGWRLRGFKGKALLKEAFEKDLPAGLFRRPKKGFGIPVARWLCGPLRPLAEELFAPVSLEGVPVLDADGVRRLWGEHLKGLADHRKPLWTLFVLLDWARRCRPTF